MLAKRIVPCLDVLDGRVVKGRNFKSLSDVDDPVYLAERYSKEGADEIVFYDIGASAENRSLFAGVLKEVARRVFIPFTVGGGVNSLDDFERLLNCGADKVSVNSGAIADPALISLAAEKYGSQCVVLSMDVKRVEGKFVVFSHGGRRNTEIEASKWAAYVCRNGAGEIVVNSIDTDGLKNGFDIHMLKAISKEANVPVVASGGAGKTADFVKLFKETDVSAALGASVFHYDEISLRNLKRELKNNGITVRI